MLAGDDMEQLFAPRLSSGSCILVADAMLRWAVGTARGYQTTPMSRVWMWCNGAWLNTDLQQAMIRMSWGFTLMDEDDALFERHFWFSALYGTCICLQGFQTTSSLAAGVATHLDLIIEMMISYCMSWLVDLMFCNVVCFKRKVVGCLMCFSFTARLTVKNSFSLFDGERTPTTEAVHHHQRGNCECLKLFFNLLI